MLINKAGTFTSTKVKLNSLLLYTCCKQKNIYLKIGNNTFCKA